VSPVRYELEFYILEDDIPHSHRRENLKSYIENTPFRKLDLFLSSREENSYSVGFQSKG
jgi:hypothetical protein